LVVALAACHGSRPGSDADRVACAQMGTAVKLATETPLPAILLANFRSAQNVASKATDVKLRASITSATRVVLGGTPTKSPYKDFAYAVTRCKQIGAALPNPESMSKFLGTN
jgi:hypothetical protein